MKSAAVLGVLAMLAAAPAAEVSRAVVDPYLEIHAALAHDSIEGIARSGRTLSDRARELGEPGEPIAAAADALAAAGDLADARAKFGTLSEALDHYRTAAHLSWPAGVRLAYCPMVRKTWVQKDGRIANPYFGKEMPTCGSFR